MAKRQVIVIGLGRFGTAVAETMLAAGCEVLGIDTDEREVQRHSQDLTQALVLDATDPTALRQIGVDDFDVAVVAIGADVEASILTTSNLAEAGVPEIVAKALSRSHARILERVGAHRVVFPEHEMGIRLGNALAGTNLIDFMELDPNYAVAELRCPAGIAGKTLREAHVRSTYGVIVLAVRDGDLVEVIPSADRTLAPSDILVVAGPTAAVEALAAAR